MSEYVCIGVMGAVVSGYVRVTSYWGAVTLTPDILSRNQTIDSKWRYWGRSRCNISMVRTLHPRHLPPQKHPLQPLPAVISVYSTGRCSILAYYKIIFILATSEFFLSRAIVPRDRLIICDGHRGLTSIADGTSEA
jgi:hypothetical protein